MKVIYAGLSIIYLFSLFIYLKAYFYDYPKKYSRLFREAYKSSPFGERFYVLILKNKYKNSIESLKEDVGNYKHYQTRKENTLRGIYGLPESNNYKSGKFKMFFNGFHKVDNTEDFIKHLDILKISII